MSSRVRCRSKSFGLPGARCCTLRDRAARRRNRRYEPNVRPVHLYSAGRRGLPGWNQQELARRARVGIATVHQLEAGMSQPRPRPRSLGAHSKPRASSSSTRTAAAPGCGYGIGTEETLDALFRIGLAELKANRNRPVRESDNVNSRRAVSLHAATRCCFLNRPAYVTLSAVAAGHRESS